MSSEVSRRGLFVAAGALLGAGLGVGVARRGSSGTHHLRPPGAAPGDDFLSACIRCGQCVEACPYETLKLTALDAGLNAGTPYLVAREVPCELCAGHESLRCIDECPTAALQPVEDFRDIRMGVAVIDRSLCFSWQGTACRSCWHACPYPNEAILLDWKTRPTVVEDACIGCGLCVRACLTEPTSIEVTAQAAFTPGSPTHVGQGSAPF